MRRLQPSLAALFVCGLFPAVAQPPDKVIIGYIYAFANIKDGLMVEGYAGDPENFRTLNSLKERNPKLKILVSVGGWTWSEGFPIWL